MVTTTKLVGYIKRLESHIPEHQFINPKISKVTTGWHIDHSLKVVNNVIIALQLSDPNTFKANMSFEVNFY